MTPKHLPLFVVFHIIISQGARNVKLKKLTVRSLLTDTPITSAGFEPYTPTKRRHERQRASQECAVPSIVIRVTLVTRHHVTREGDYLFPVA